MAAARRDPRFNQGYRYALPELDSSSHSERDASSVVSARSSSSSVAGLSTPINKSSKVITPRAPRRSKVASRRSPRLASQKGRVLNFDSSDEEDTGKQRRERAPARSPSKPRSKSRPRSKTPGLKRQDAHRAAPGVSSRLGRVPRSSTPAKRHRSRSQNSKSIASNPKTKAGRKAPKQKTEDGRKVGRSTFYCD